MIELKPCPFCGCDQIYSKVHSLSFNGEVLRSVICGNCSATTHGYDDKPVNDWNARTQSQRISVERLKELCESYVEYSHLAEVMRVAPNYQNWLIEQGLSKSVPPKVGE